LKIASSNDYPSLAYISVHLRTLVSSIEAHRYGLKSGGYDGHQARRQWSEQFKEQILSVSHGRLQLNISLKLPSSTGGGGGIKPGRTHLSLVDESSSPSSIARTTPSSAASSSSTMLRSRSRSPSPEPLVFPPDQLLQRERERSRSSSPPPARHPHQASRSVLPPAPPAAAAAAPIARTLQRPSSVNAAQVHGIASSTMSSLPRSLSPSSLLPDESGITDLCDAHHDDDDQVFSDNDATSNIHRPDDNISRNNNGNHRERSPSPLSPEIF
jgi:hypothetical protein